MHVFLIDLTANVVALLIFTIGLGIVNFFARRRRLKKEAALRASMTARFEKLVAKIVDEKHREKAQIQLRAAIESGNVAAINEVSGLILNYLEKQTINTKVDSNG